MPTTDDSQGTDSTTDTNQETSTQPAETTTDKIKEETTNPQTTLSYETTTSPSETTENKSEETTNQQTTENNRETTTNPSETTTNPSEATTDSEGGDTTTNTITTTLRPQSNGNSSCPPVEEGQAHFVCPTGFRRHPQDCGMFYQCTQSPETSHLSIVTFNCPNGTVYDEDAIQCRDRSSSDNCISKSQNATLLRGTLFDFDAETSPIVRNLSKF